MPEATNIQKRKGKNKPVSMRVAATKSLVADKKAMRQVNQGRKEARSGDTISLADFLNK